MKVTVTKNLNIRVGKPSVNAPNHGYLLPGDDILTDGKLYLGDFFEGNPYWYKDASGNYYWSGGVEVPTRLVDVKRIIVDLHCHPSLKPYNNTKYNIWQRFHNPKVRHLFNKNFKEFLARICVLKKYIHTFAIYSQSNLEACFEGNNKLIFTSIYPVERPFVRPDRPFKNREGATSEEKKLNKNLKKLFYDKHNNPDLSIEKRLIEAITGFSKETSSSYVEDIQDDTRTIDYFQDFIGEYHTLREAQEKPFAIRKKGMHARFKLINDYDEITKLRTDEIAGIVQYRRRTFFRNL